MRVGLFFGSFNPIHIGHLIIANHILNETDLNKIWFVISPQNPFKPAHTLLNNYDRLHLVNKATENDPRIKASDVEFKLPRPSYTIDTLNHLQEKHPTNDFVIIMGSDSFQNLNKWKNYETIIKGFQLSIYKRPGFEIVNNINASIITTDAPLLDISATYIRELVRQNKSIKYLVPENIELEIQNNVFFRQKK
jgi:nicotinate-nucleotide adenylyltransferase